MGKQAQTIELITNLGINYIPCCKIVLMFYNVEYMSRFFYGLYTLLYVWCDFKALNFD